MRLKRSTVAAIVPALCSLTGHAADVAPRLIVLDKPAEQVVVAKAVSYRQSAEGKLTLLQYDFFAEFAPTATEASGVVQLIAPRGEVIPFRAGGAGLAGDGLRNFHSLEDLNQRVPNGTYTVRYTRPGTRPFVATAELNATAATMPAPFKLKLTQNGREISALDVDAAQPLTIQALMNGPSSSAALTFVHVADCFGKRVARTAKFSGEPDLTYRGLSYSLPENTLDRGTGYQLYVESGSYTLNRTDGVPVFASYPVAVFLDFTTRGETRTQCPSPIYQMDSRQSDRPRAP